MQNQKTVTNQIFVDATVNQVSLLLTHSLSLTISKLGVDSVTVTIADLYLEGNANNLPPSTLQYSKKFWDILPAFNISSSVECLTTSAAAQFSRPFTVSREVKFVTQNSKLKWQCQRNHKQMSAH
jgi:hypothetical protein